ncbi:VTC domain-containing protein [Virgisporangium aliadipatigenens]|uniref:VTC domain-containing protein n=1 Tax=Virgisporangium aliadipatigenens TaxID=741659 RepID=A0A8J4DNS0_9ACTN|nr:polyphosphate polymerase domain-containing protein [Virgisporangium aliadipatigenens]GIJ45190.1 VTC domain-containing protein [Virgisporangium aliadipatigenens]
MRTISLTELTERAALLTRVDRKYVLPIDELPALLREIDARVLEIDGRREFGYRSVYYDTPELASYLGAARRRPKRFKVRTRTYLDTGLHVLELKTRDGRGTTVKRRLPHEDLHTLAARLAPALVTHYRRMTLFLPADGSRVTLDTDLAWALPDGAGLRLPGRAVVETKCAPGRASAVDRLLWSLHQRPCAISKYATGLAALRPDLPANHWKPVLRRHFEEGR